MSTAVNDDYGKKFQLTDSLLKRFLKQEQYDSIKSIEPVIIVTDESNSSKQLKSPGYKHVAISSGFLYVINTPAKQESDLLLSVSLEDVESVQVVNDKVDFLQGDLQESAQHTQLVCKQQHCSIAAALLLKATSLALMSTHSGSNSEEMRVLSISSSLSSSNLLEDSISSSTIDVTAKYRKSKSLNTSPESSLTRDNFKLLKQDVSCKQKRAKNKKTGSTAKLQLEGSGNLHQSSIRRPLPKPSTGTEKLAASYTQGMLQKKISSVNKEQLERSTSNNKSLQSFYYHKSSSNQVPTLIHRNPPPSSHLNQSWNDILKAEQRRAKEPKTLHSDINTASGNLNSSISSKLLKLMKGSKENLNESEAFMPITDGDVKTSSSSSRDVVNDNTKEDHESYTIDIYTVSKGSILFYILEQSWIYSVISGTYKLETTLGASQRKVSLQSQRKMEKDAVIQKFTQLKEEILSSTQYCELFLLTKELKHACDHYLTVKKCVWKSASFLKFYVEKMHVLVNSGSNHATDRMDEMDVLILVGEFFVSIFQDSGMIGSRNMLLNDTGATFAKNFLHIILTTPQMKCLSNEKKWCDDVRNELFDLMAIWSDMCVSLLFEIINAAKQSLWCCPGERRSFDVTVLTTFLTAEEEKLRNMIDHIMMKLMSAFSFELEYVPSPSNVVLLYKSMFVLHFVCVNCSTIVDYVKTYYHEEVKYYISKEDNIKRIPSNYPITCLMTSFLPILISTIT